MILRKSKWLNKNVKPLTRKDALDPKVKKWILPASEGSEYIRTRYDYLFPPKPDEEVKAFGYFIGGIARGIIIYWYDKKWEAEGDIIYFLLVDPTVPDSKKTDVLKALLRRAVYEHEHSDKKSENLFVILPAHYYDTEEFYWEAFKRVDFGYCNDGYDLDSECADFYVRWHDKGLD